METVAEKPLVTVLMPVRNGAAHVQSSIESILGQTFTDFELLVIDDGSMDATPELLRSIQDPRLRIVTNSQNLGLVPTLNRGLELARGELIARQDHDDFSLPARLGKQVEYLRAHPDCALVGTEAIQTDAQGRKAFRLLRPSGAESIRWYLCFDNAFIHSSVMFRREVIRRESGGYPRSLHSEDYALWSQVARTHSTANLPEALLLYREHSSSVTGSMSASDAAAFDEATGLIRLENLRQFFGAAATPGDARILSTYRREFSRDSAQHFVATLDRLADEARGDIAHRPDFQRTLAIQFSELAYRLLPLSKRASLNLYLRAITLCPEIVTAIPWLRVCALLLLGENARHLHRQIFSARQ